MDKTLLQILSEEISFNRTAAEKYNGLIFGEKSLEATQLRHARDMAKYYLAKADTARELFYKYAATTSVTCAIPQPEGVLVEKEAKLEPVQEAEEVVDLFAESFGDDLV